MGTRSKNDAYFSYRWRKERRGEKYLTLEQWKKWRAKRPKMQNGATLSEWSAGQRPFGWVYKTNAKARIKRRISNLEKQMARPRISAPRYKKLDLEVKNLKKLLKAKK